MGFSRFLWFFSSWNPHFYFRCKCNDGSRMERYVDSNRRPFHPQSINNMPDTNAFYPQGNAARNMSLPGYPGNVSSNNSLVTTVSDSSGSSHIVRDYADGLLAESLPGFSGAHPDNAAAVEWSAAEQQMLQEGLVKYADEPNIVKYIKIAANLRDKTVREVALRCQWMMQQGNRRRQEEFHHVRKPTCRKDKLAESQSTSNLPPAIHDAAGYSYPAFQTGKNEGACGALSATATQLLDQNSRVLEQIDANLSCNKLQDNVNLFECSRKYIEEIKTILKKMPGGGSQLPELPPLLGEEQKNPRASTYKVQ
ncbi:hypothetical protein Dimus_019493 [Dionaea muscipula]